MIFNPLHRMRKDYYENIYLQKMDILDYQEVFKQSIKSFKSSKIISNLLQRISVDLDELKMKRFLRYLIDLYCSDSEFIFKTDKRNLLRIIFTYTISDVIFDEMYEFLKIFGGLDVVFLDNEQKKFFAVNINNYYIYIKLSCDKTCDVFVVEDSLTIESMPRFYELYKDITLENINSFSLCEYYLCFKDKKYVKNLLCIMNKESSINVSIDKDIYAVVDPFIISVSDIKKYIKIYACYLNIDFNSRCCLICDRKIVNLDKFFSINKSILDQALLSAEKQNDILFFLSHFKESRTVEMLEKIGKEIFSDSSENIEIIETFKYFNFKESKECEDFLCDLFDYLRKYFNEKKLFTFIKIVKKIEMTEKITLRFFMLLFTYYISTKNTFLKLQIKNAVHFHRLYFNNYKEKIIDLYLTNFLVNLNQGDAIFEAISSFYSLSEPVFVNVNLFCIIPSLSRLNLIEHIDIEFFENGVIFYAAYLIENNLFMTSDYFKSISIGEFSRKYGFSVFTVLICRSRSAIECFIKLLGIKLQEYILKNISPILFKLRYFYSENSIVFKFCIFEIFQFLFDTLNERLPSIINHIMPFLEYFYSEVKMKDHCLDLNHNGSECRDSCLKKLEEKISNFSSVLAYPGLINLIGFSHLKIKNCPIDLIDKLTLVSNSKSRMLNERTLEQLETIWDSFFIKIDTYEEISENKSISMLSKTSALKMKRNFSIKDGITPNTLDPIDNLTNKKNKICKLTSRNNSKKEEKTNKNNFPLRLSKNELVVRSFCKYILKHDDVVFKKKLNYLIMNLANNCKKKMLTSKFLGKIGILSGEIKSTTENEKNYIYMENFNLETIAIAAIEYYLIDIDNEYQDAYFFVIQETLKFIDKKEKIKKSVLKIVDQFYYTKFNMEIIITEVSDLKITSNTTYKSFLETLNNFVLTILNENKINDFFELLKLSKPLKSTIKEFYIFCGIRKTLNEGLCDYSVLNEYISFNETGSINRKIKIFLLRCNVFCDYKLISKNNCIKLCLAIEDFYYLNRIVELEYDDEETNKLLLQYSYYQIKDFDNCKGLNDVHDKMGIANIFFDLCMENKFNEAKKIYNKHKKSEIKSDIYTLRKKNFLQKKLNCNDEKYMICSQDGLFQNNKFLVKENNTDFFDENENISTKDKNYELLNKKIKANSDVKKEICMDINENNTINNIIRKNRIVINDTNEDDENFKIIREKKNTTSINTKKQNNNKKNKIIKNVLKEKDDIDEDNEEKIFGFTDINTESRQKKLNNEFEAGESLKKIKHTDEWILDEINLLNTVFKDKNMKSENEIDIEELLQNEKMAKNTLSTWNFNFEKEHIIFDCKLIQETKNLQETFNTLILRRKVSGLNKFIIKKHIEIADILLEKQDMYIDFHEIDDEKQDKKIDIISRFKEETLLDKIKFYRKEKNFEKCKEEINKMLVSRNWIALYELAKYNLIKNKKNDARNILKKLNSYLENNTPLFEKSNILLARLLNTKEGYEEISKVLNKSEKLLFYTGKFYENKDDLLSLDFYIKSLSFGNKYINETLPKIIHLFTGNPCLKDKKSSEFSSVSANFFANTTIKIDNLMEFFDIKHFIPFFNGLISKISHNDQNVIKTVKKLLLELYEKYPHQTLWPSLIMINSTQKETSKLMKCIIDQMNFDSRVILKNLIELSQSFVKIATFNAKENSVLSLTKHFKINLDYKHDVVVPSTDLNVKINGFIDEIKIFFSLQSPKRITIIGENGFTYSILCKPNDDLRRDSRFMDLNKMLNYIFRKEKETYNRNSYIRIYNVVPITSKNGIIEWIEGLQSLRGIIDPLYKEMNISISNEQKKHKAKKRIDVDKFDTILKSFPPVLYKYFEKEKSPQVWYSKKQRFIRSYAVMNVVGWFMGLGDRHLENIMIDNKTGDTFHVDLNCIFEKAKKLEIAERVPFRLTQNIVHTFGPLKIEGTYRKTMEVVLDVMIKNKDLIMSNLLSFIYDPLQEWKVGRKSVEDSAKILLDSLRNKLNIEDVSLVVDGLIAEATNDYNLAMMYIGWCSFI